jgi:hypothetical protein
MATTTSGDDKQLLAQLVALTDAVRQLAERPTPPPPASFETATNADRIRQRVAFGYQALGTLMGRVSSASGDEFDVRVVLARRRRDVIEFDRLPPGASWVELRAGNKVELLRIDEDLRDSSDDAPEPDAASTTPARHDRPDRGSVRPREFARTDPIGSIVVLRGPRGPLIAFGPRLGPVRSGSPDDQPT